MATQTQQPQNPITTPMTYAQLQALAQSQAQATITGENAPLQAQVDTYGQQAKDARAQIAGQGAKLLPYVQSSAGEVSRFNQNALSME
jgi:hypothetical protein